MDLQAALDGQQGGEQADGAGPDDQDDLGVPDRPGGDPFDVVPGLGDHARRLEQHPGPFQGRVELDHVAGADAVALAQEPVQLLDAVFGVAAVMAHVPLAGGATQARLGVGLADDANHQVARPQVARGRGLQDPAEGLMAEHQPLPP